MVKNKSGIQKNKAVWLCRACVVQSLTFDDAVANNGVADSGICNFSGSALVTAKTHFIQHCKSKNCKWKSYKEYTSLNAEKMEFINKQHFLEIKAYDIEFSKEGVGSYSRRAGVWHPFRRDTDGQLFRSMLKAFWLYMPALDLEMDDDSAHEEHEQDASSKREKTYKYSYDVMYAAWFSGLNATDRKLVEGVEEEEDNDEDIDEDNDDEEEEA